MIFIILFAFIAGLFSNPLEQALTDLLERHRWMNNVAGKLLLCIVAGVASYQMTLFVRWIWRH